MKLKLLLLSPCAALLVMCADGKSKEADNQTEVIAEAPLATVPLTPYNGVWVNKGYIDAVRLNKSPFASSGFLDNINSLVIKANARDAETEVGIYYNTDAGGATLSQKDGDVYIMFGSDVSMVNMVGDMLSFDHNGRKLEFIKTAAAPNPLDASKGVEDITRKLLFAKRNFSCNCPELGVKASNILLKEDGAVENFYGYNKYDIATSFVVDPYPMDMIYFKSDTLPAKGFHFVYEGNRLKLFKLGFNETTEEVIKTPFCILVETEFYKLLPNEREAYFNAYKNEISAEVAQNYDNYTAMGDLMEIHNLLEAMEQQKDHTSFYLYAAGRFYENPMAMGNNEIVTSLVHRIDEYFYMIFLRNPQLFYSYMDYNKNTAVAKRVKAGIKGQLQVQQDIDMNSRFADSVYTAHLKYCSGNEKTVKAFFK